MKIFFICQAYLYDFTPKISKNKPKKQTIGDVL